MPARRGVSAADVRELLLQLYGVTPGRSYGFPSFLLGGKFFARFRDDDSVLVLQLGSIDDREVLMALDPRAFFFADHYRDYPAVLIRLADVRPDLLADAIAIAWGAVGAQRSKTKRRKRKRT